jgi:hypothetical protein
LIYTGNSGRYPSARFLFAQCGGEIPGNVGPVFGGARLFTHGISTWIYLRRGHPGALDAEALIVLLAIAGVLFLLFALSPSPLS